MKLNTKALKDVEFGRVVVATGTYTARITAKVEPNKTKTGQNLVVEHKLLDPILNLMDGRQIENNGRARVTRWIGLQPNDSGTYDPNAVIKELGVAAGLDCDNDDVTLEALQGKVVCVKRAHKPAKDGNPEGNDVQGWTAPTEEQLGFASKVQ